MNGFASPTQDTGLNQQLAAITDYDMWFVAERIGRDQLLQAAEVDEAIVQFKRFAYMVAIGYTNLTMPVKSIDIVWHTFLLFTEEYEQFCIECIGSYLHHKPTTSRTISSTSTSLDFFETYETVFGVNIRRCVNEQATCCGGGDGCRSRSASLDIFPC